MNIAVCLLLRYGDVIVGLVTCSGLFIASVGLIIEEGFLHAADGISNGIAVGIGSREKGVLELSELNEACDFKFDGLHCDVSFEVFCSSVPLDCFNISWRYFSFLGKHIFLYWVSKSASP